MDFFERCLRLGNYYNDVSGKLTLPDLPELYIPSRIANYGFQLFPIEIRQG
jgi:hypothetical protein